jgi:phosphatidylinositol glycan class B
VQTTRFARADALLLALVVVAALVVRLGAVLALPSLHHPDENFQFFEQAHRLAFGYGVVPWEYEEGIRSLVVPWLLSRLLIVAGAAASPEALVLLQRAALVVLSVVPVGAVFLWGLQRGRLQALLLGLVAASWFELVYFSGRPLSEAIACGLLVAAIALALRAERADGTGYALVGLLLASAVMLRFHLMVGVLPVAAVICWADRRRCWPLLIGAVLPVAVFGLADWVAWGWPFHSFVRAVELNVVRGAASHYGVEPWHWYGKRALQNWSLAAPVLLALALWQPRRNALWLLAAAGILLSHSLIPHKEYRFVMPAYACIVLAAASTSANVIARIVAGRPQAWRAAGFVAAAVAWLSLSVGLAVKPSYRSEWTRARQLIEASYWLHRQPDLCGVLLYGTEWFQSGGYAHLHRKVPIYTGRADGATASEAYNYAVLSGWAKAALPAGYARRRCFGAEEWDLCVVHREGGCKAVPGLESLSEKRRLGSPWR